MKSNTGSEKIFNLLIFALAVAGIILRFDGLGFRSLEYDEIWTIQHYLALPVSEIFTKLATPNNHPLHTLLVQWSTAFSGATFTTVRFPAFLFGCLTIFFAMFFTWKATKRKDAVLFSGAAIAFCGYLIHFSQTARGYSIQTFFVLLTAAALYGISRNEKSIPHALLFLFAAIASCLTITSGLAFVCALCGAYLIVRFHRTDWKSLFRENGTFLAAGVLFLIFASFWYGAHYLEIKAGQVFGYSVLHPWDFLKFSGLILAKLFLFPFVIIHAAVLFRKNHPGRKISLFTLCFIGLTLLTALATKAGPDRVYLPLYPVAAVSSAMVLPGLFASFRKEKFTIPAFCCLAVLLTLPIQKTKQSQESPDYIPLMQEIIKTVPAEIYVNIPPNDAYPVLYNYPETVKDFQKRLAVPELKGFLQVNASGKIVVYDRKAENPHTIMMPREAARKMTSEEGVSLDCYELVPLTAEKNCKGKMLFLTIQPMPKELFSLMFSRLNAGEKWYLANLFLTGREFDRFGTELTAGAYLCPEAVCETEYYLTRSRESGFKWNFYLINLPEKN